LLSLRRIAARRIGIGKCANVLEKIVSHIDATGTIEGAPGLKDEHLPVFDCSLRPQNGTRFIHHCGTCG
jgi:ribonucleoside-diphosphate reductase alpha chain